VLALAASALALSAAAPPAVRLVPVANFVQPVEVGAPPRDSRRLFVTERLGRVRVVRDGRLLSRPFLDLRGQVEIRSRAVERDQGGLLSLAFAPDYATSRRFYVLYTDRADRLRVDELRRSAANPDRADPASRRLVLDLPRTASVDVGSHIAFGPDRLLYAGFGFGSDANASQDLSTFAGKLVRLDPSAGGAPEIFALGLRVPWRFSFDRKTGDLALADVGDSRVEEVDFAPRGTPAGANYGWPFVEGDHRRMPGGADLVSPVLTRRHGRRMCALIGGVVVRDPHLRTLVGRYLYGDLCSGEVRSVRLRRPRATGDRREPVTVSGIDSFGEDARGRVYLVDVGGPVFRLAAVE
jgi:glucose/arabinose dehydrogenase